MFQTRKGASAALKCSFLTFISSCLGLELPKKNTHTDEDDSNLDKPYISRHSSFRHNFQFRYVRRCAYERSMGLRTAWVELRIICKLYKASLQMYITFDFELCSDANAHCPSPRKMYITHTNWSYILGMMCVAHGSDECEVTAVYIESEATELNVSIINHIGVVSLEFNVSDGRCIV